RTVFHLCGDGARADCAPEGPVRRAGGAQDMKAAATAAVALAALIAVALLAPQWLVFMTMLVLAKGGVVRGLLVLMRTGLVSFGQGLYFGIGAYAAALLSHHYHIADAAVMLAAGAVGAGL